MKTRETKTLTLGGSSDPALTNTIGSLTQLGGVLTLNKTGVSTWQLNAANNHTGVTTVSEGVLSISNASALGTTAAGTTVSGGALQLSNNIVVTDEALTLTAGAGRQRHAEQPQREQHLDRQSDGGHGSRREQPRGAQF